MVSVLLATASPRRREWLSSRLRETGIILDFSEAGGEEPVPEVGIEVSKQVEVACLHKAETMIRELGGYTRHSSIVVSDTLVEDPDDPRAPLGKPSDLLVAAAMLMRLSGRRHRVWSSTALSYPPGGSGALELMGGWTADIWTEFSIAEFEGLGEEDIAGLIESGSWLGKAGGYDMAGEAGRFLNLVEGEEVTVLGFAPNAIRHLIDSFS
jgi:septum formation protein